MTHTRAEYRASRHSASTLKHAQQKLNNNSHSVLLIPEFCPGGLRQRLTVNSSTLLV